MPQSSDLSDAELLALVRGGGLTPEDEQALSPSERVRLQALTTPPPTETWGQWALGLPGRGVQYARDNPAKTAAVIGGIAAPILTGGVALLPELLAAGLGGAGGAGLGMLYGAATGAPEEAQPAMTTPAGVVKRMATEGAGQAVSAGVGRGVGAALKGTGNVVMRSILPSKIAKAFPAAAETLNANAIIPTTAAGLAKAKGLRDVASQATKDLVDAAEDAGAQAIRRREILPGTSRAFRQATEEAWSGNPGGHELVQGQIDRLMAAQPMTTFPAGSMRVGPSLSVTAEPIGEGVGGAAGITPRLLGTSPTTVMAEPTAGALGRATLPEPRAVGGFFQPTAPAVVERPVAGLFQPTAPAATLADTSLAATAARPASAGAASAAETLPPGTAPIFGERGLTVSEPAIPLDRAPAIIRRLQDRGLRALTSQQAQERESNLASVAANDLAAAIRRATDERVPGFAESNAITQNMIGATRAAQQLQHAKVNPVKLAALMGTAGTLAGATEYGTHNPLYATGAAAIPLALAFPQTAGPAAIAAYQAGRLPYAQLLQMVSPTVLQALGITDDNHQAAP